MDELKNVFGLWVLGKDGKIEICGYLYYRKFE